MKAFTIVTWIGAFQLMVYQYRKGLSESWYSLKLFWYSNFICQTYVTIYGFMTEYKTVMKVFGCFEVLFALILVVQLLKTKSKTFDKPRGSHKESYENTLDLNIDMEKRDSLLGKSMLEHYEEQKDHEPKIYVRIKPRTKDHPSDDFKLVVKYEIDMSKTQQKSLADIVPSTPREEHHKIVTEDSDIFEEKTDSKPLISKDKAQSMKEKDS